MQARETAIAANLLKVSDLVPSEVADRVRLRYEEEFGEPPEQPGGWYRPDDWKRTSFVLERLRPGGRLLDVGAGAGQFANMLASTEQWDSVTALDHTRFGKYREYFDRLQRTDASIVELPFDDAHFDVVTCMEVLEHVPNDVFLPGIAELRRRVPRPARRKRAVSRTGAAFQGARATLRSLRRRRPVSRQRASRC